MSKINDGGPAYPRSTGPHDNWDSGMTVRQVYAKAAMHAIMRCWWQDNDPKYRQRVAQESYAMADAMIAFEANESK